MSRKLLAAASLLALAACTTARDDAAPAPAAPAADATAALESQHWSLLHSTDQAGQAIAALQPPGKQPLQLDFADGRLGVSGGCNRIGAGYRLDAGTLHVGPTMQTQMACADRTLMELDAAIAARLQGALRTQLQGGEPPQLQLVAANGDTLVLTGAPTAQARYGGEGATVFFEVAPQRVACAHPLIRDMQCLRVRERSYATNGTLASQGEWQPLYQAIEGYTHTPGTRNVLRVKKYAIKNPPADAPAVAYVLDLVVEAELVER
ncbi:META and DUF4377 domain-containing protein [Lysobacter solisilvae (ex Woo and Kim 2020)]|uniref:META and DUF4377 domain-containing protein n=1 Tax=Agrilutibacter terrestris TaxID=2865112 RepID=A0A7H0G0W3_9GAMM|nr:META and DUF4377 domain-containing protein [Lysobacter terrestris]QNP41929.1 META and DUF4377 domain-containing protein [Lysobacter terrestris]